MRLLLSFGLLVLLLAGYVVSHALNDSNTRIIEIGTFLVLALTLIAIIIYAYDTNSIARVSREQWVRNSVLGTTYTMETTSDGRTLFRLHNPSTLVVRAKVRLNPRVYDETVAHNHPALNGQET